MFYSRNGYFTTLQFMYSSPHVKALMPLHVDCYKAMFSMVSLDKSQDHKAYLMALVLLHVENYPSMIAMLSQAHKSYFKPFPFQSK